MYPRDVVHNKLTVGSLRGLPQPGLVLSSALARRAPLNVAQAGAAPAAAERMPRRCCGTGCAGCPVGERIRALRARRG